MIGRTNEYFLRTELIVRNYYRRHGRNPALYIFRRCATDEEYDEYYRSAEQ